MMEPGSKLISTKIKREAIEFIFFQEKAVFHSIGQSPWNVIKV
jgi:hypothetical protein